MYDVNVKFLNISFLDKLQYMYYMNYMIPKNSEIFKAIKATSNPVAAERDYMECRILDTMFANESLYDSMIFSGGATLTKSYNICPRISHDLDLVTTDFTEVPDNRSINQLKKFHKRFKEFVFDELRAEINYAINQDKRFMITTDREWVALNNPEQQVSYPTLHLLYTSALNNSFEDICIEITPRLYDAAAVSYRAVAPYSVRTPMREIPTVAYEQTFWDKVFALHCMAMRGLPRNRFFLSRHYFDVVQMADMVNIVDTYHLLKDTERYQKTYTTKEIEPISAAADICLVPGVETLNTLGADYAKHDDQFLQTPPRWSDVVAQLTELKSCLNKLEGGR